MIYYNHVSSPLKMGLMFWPDWTKQVINHFTTDLYSEKDMPVEFEPIITNDFTTFTPGRIAPHIKLEQFLTALGGGSTLGSNYKHHVLKLAGWKYDSIIGYAKHPDLASEAFNKVRSVLIETQDKDEIVKRLSNT